MFALASIVASAAGLGLMARDTHRGRRRRRTQAPASRVDAPPGEPSLMDDLCAWRDAHLMPAVDAAYAVGSRLARRLRPTESTDDDRRARLVEVVGDARSARISARERDANRLLTLTSGTFALTSAAFFFPPLNVLALPALVYISFGSMRTAVVTLVEEGEVRIEARLALGSLGMLVLHAHWILATFRLLLAVNGKVVVTLLDETEQELVDVLGEPPEVVRITRGDAVVQVPFSVLRPGDRLVLEAGDRVPIDGQVLAGEGAFDQRALTGESVPAERTVGEPVHAGTLMLAGRVVVRVEEMGDRTVAARIGQTLSRVVDYRTEDQLRGIEIADRTALPTIALAGVTGLALGLTSGVAVAMCSFGRDMLYTGPLSVLRHLRLATERGVLIKDGRALERMADVDVFVFDKTGTLTLGLPRVARIEARAPWVEDDVLRFAGSLERHQPHPIARAIVEACARRDVPLAPRDETAVEPGFGLRGRVDGRQVHVGSARYMAHAGVAMPPGPAGDGADGLNLVFVAVDGTLAGHLALESTVRPETIEVLRALEARGYALVILSGDSEAATRRLAAAVGAGRYRAEVLPEQKGDVVRALQADGHKACFVGDGINDAIALKQAHVSVSLRGATSIARDTAQIVLAEDDLRGVVALADISTQLDENMRRNLWISMVPGAVGALAVYTLGAGIVTTAVLAWASLALGIANAALPGQPADGGISGDQPVVPVDARRPDTGAESTSLPGSS